MIDLISYGISIVFYVLQALGLYTIAQRRGIRHAWLAWLPVGNVWVIGSIADDFKLKTRNKQQKMRVWLPVLAAVTLVLCAVVLVTLFLNVLAPMLDVLTYDDIMTIYEMQQGDSVSYMYAPAEEAVMEDMIARMEASITDEMLEGMVGSLLLTVGLALVLAVTGIVSGVLEYICLYSIFASCDPQNKTLYLVLSLLFSLQGVFLFLCRNKDLGMTPSAPALPGGFQPNGQQPPNYWQQN